jgi:hypothetical protein
MKKLFIPLLLSTIILFAACKKDKSSNNTAAIEGTYKFKYISANTNSTITGSLGDKAVTTSDYTTTNNGGTITFSNGTLTANGLTYTVDTEAKLYEYDGTDLLDSTSFPFAFTLPQSTSSGTYKLIGSDSIYFPQGRITAAVDGNGYYQSGAGGGRYSFNGTLLTITQKATKDSTFDDSGETYNMLESASASIVMEKQ